MLTNTLPDDAYLAALINNSDKDTLDLKHSWLGGFCSLYLDKSILDDEETRLDLTKGTYGASDAGLRYVEYNVITYDDDKNSGTTYEITFGMQGYPSIVLVSADLDILIDNHITVAKNGVIVNGKIHWNYV